MYVKKLKRRCEVRGCKNTDTYAISLSREVGNTVIICKSCLGKALGAIDDVKPEPEKKASHRAIPSLFFSHRPVEDVPAAVEAPTEAEAPAEAEAPMESDADDTSTEAEAEAEYVCPHCGQVCKSELGLQKHIAAKHKE